MSNSTTWRNSCLLHFLPFNRHNFTLTHEWLKIFQLILQLSGAISSSEIIYSFKDGITHPGDILALIILFFDLLDGAACLLHNWINNLFAVHSGPVIVLEVEVYHIVGNRSVLELASENDHGCTCISIKS